MNSLKSILLIAALALLAGTAQADHSVTLHGGLLIQQDGYQIYIGTPLHHYRGGYGYYAPRHHKPRYVPRGHYRIRDPMLHDYRRYRHQLHYRYNRGDRPHRSNRHMFRSDRQFDRTYRSGRQPRQWHR